MTDPLPFGIVPGSPLAIAIGIGELVAILGGWAVVVLVMDLCVKRNNQRRK